MHKHTPHACIRYVHRNNVCKHVLYVAIPTYYVCMLIRTDILTDTDTMYTYRYRVYIYIHIGTHIYLFIHTRVCIYIYIYIYI